MRVSRSNLNTGKPVIQASETQGIDRRDYADEHYERKGQVLIKLSPREMEVLALFAEKGRIKPVAESLETSVNTVRAQKNSIMRKLGAKNAVDLVSSAIKKGLVKL